MVKGNKRLLPSSKINLKYYTCGICGKTVSCVRPNFCKKLICHHYRKVHNLTDAEVQTALDEHEIIPLIVEDVGSGTTSRTHG